MSIASTIQDRVGSLLAPAATASQPYLAIYMNDQLALGVLWREVAQRSARENEGTDAGAALERVAAAIGEDVETFEQIMARLEIPKTHVKPLLAMVGERFGRLKLNGRLTGYSPLSRFEELDFLLMGIDGKVVLWTNLRDHALLGARLHDVDFDQLIDRARQQRALLEPFHAESGREALGGGAM
jgi:hypothetical protein